MIQNTQAEENYLKAIYNLSGREIDGVSTNSLAKLMQTKASSVTDMIKKLAHKKLVDHARYQGVKLTAKGEGIALNVVRKHRLWEYFLVEKLDFPWDEVHDIAEQLEHVSSKQLTNKLDQFLGHPKKDPHGDPIPDVQVFLPAMPLSFDSGKNYPLSTLQKLAVSQPNGHFSVQGIQPSGDTILLIHPDHAPKYFTIPSSLLSNDPVIIQINTGGKIIGKVLQKDGLPLARVLMHVKWSPGKPYTDYARTDENGAFVFEHIPEGEYEIQTFLPNSTKEAEIKRVMVRENEVTTVNFTN
ncbi:MAG: carboxypeptidase regulatory-like domain-containing protein [Bacteroidetes bacterium]|nr:carboxypeptidase regulatory-like domain-containing protein [Bacteroidota bacterium]